MKGRGAAAYVLSPEQQLKEKRPGMPENLKRIREQQITDIPRIPFEPELNHWNYPRVTPEDLESLAAFRAD